jgi:hypothetical protein
MVAEVGQVVGNGGQIPLVSEVGSGRLAEGMWGPAGLLGGVTFVPPGGLEHLVVAFELIGRCCGECAAFPVQPVECRLDTGWLRTHGRFYGQSVDRRGANLPFAAVRSTLFSVGNVWGNPEEDEKHLAWTRTLYRDVFAATGGVPVPNDRTGGCYINWPDPDLLEEEWNQSGVPWSQLYYGGNYKRLQEAKGRWYPHQVFNHVLSVEPG